MSRLMTKNISGRRGGSNVRGDANENSRSNLLTKVKYLEDELTRMDTERNRLLHQLDKVCEEKDSQIKELKTQLYEKGVEMDHQRSTFKAEQNRLKDEITDLKSTMAFIKAASENDIHQLAEEKSELINKLEDLKDYMEHKELTMDRIKELEQQLESSKVEYETKLKDFQDQMEIERQNIRKQITQEVSDITANLEESCMKKISADARLALDKCNQLNEKLHETETQLADEKKYNLDLGSKLHNRQLRLEIAENLLQELLKSLQRKFICRKDAAIQVHLMNGADKSRKYSRASESSNVKRILSRETENL